MNADVRAGRVTSSKIYKLFGSNSVRKTYREECVIEAKLNACLAPEAHSQAISWGEFFEAIVFNRELGPEYEYSSNGSIKHKKYPDYYAGTPDGYVPGVKSAELKCYYRKKFSLLSDAILSKDPEYIKKTHPKEYWQAVSNALLLGVVNAELLSFMPYAKDFEDQPHPANTNDILRGYRYIASHYEGPNPWEYRFIAEDPIERLNYLPEDSIYNNLNRFTWKVPPSEMKAILLEVEDYKQYKDAELKHL